MSQSVQKWLVWQIFKYLTDFLFIEMYKYVGWYYRAMKKQISFIPAQTLLDFYWTLSTFLEASLGDASGGVV